jgi:hypothetical protein
MRQAITRMTFGITAISSLTVGSAALAGAGTGYVTANWADNRVHFLDNNLNSIGSFAAGSDLPNGMATNGTLIWTGHFTTNEVIAYDFTGAEQFRWSFGDGVGVQGMDLISNEELAVMDAFADRIAFFDPFDGSFVRQIPTAVGTTIEGLAWDGEYLWQLGDDEIYATDVSSGAVLHSVPNPAVNDAFSGTGLTASGPNELTVAAAGGNWYKISMTDGSLLSSGNNGLDMFALKAIPIPAPAALALLGVAGLVSRRRRR